MINWITHYSVLMIYLTWFKIIWNYTIHIIINEFLDDTFLDQYLGTLWNVINILNCLNIILMFVLFIIICLTVKPKEPICDYMCQMHMF